MQKELIIFTGSKAPENISAEAIVMAFDNSDCTVEHISLPRLMHENLARIRNEMRALVYDLGRLKFKGDEVQEMLKAGDSLSMWWCSLLYEGHPKVVPALYFIFKLRALEIFINENNIQNIKLYTENNLLISTFEDFCLKTKCSFKHFAAIENVTKNKSSLLKRIYYNLPGPIKAIGRGVMWFLKCKLLFPHYKTKNNNTGKQASIITYFPNIDLNLAEKGIFKSKYWENLHDLLKERTASYNINWLFIPFPSPQADLKKCCELRNAFLKNNNDTGTMLFIDEFISFFDIFKAFFRYMCLCLSSIQIEKTVANEFYLGNSQINVWPWLSFCYTDSFRGWRCLERCLQRIALQNYVQWLGKQKWLIFPMENCPWERMVTEAAHKAKIAPVYGIQHSVIRETDLRYFDDARTFNTEDCLNFQPDKIFCNGFGAYDALINAGLNPNKVEIIEALRYMYLGKLKPRQNEQNKNEYKKLIVVTSFFADETNAHLQMLAKALPLLDKWKIIVKPHPYLPVKDILADFLPTNKMPFISDQPVNELLQDDCVLWASNSTTVALEAALSGLPVMVQAPVDDFNLCPIQNMPGVATIYNIEDLNIFLKNTAPVDVKPGYFALDQELPRWRALLDN